MAAAARLAVAGHRVAVYERTETYGGALGRFERDGFAFDTGPGLLHLPAVYRDLFVKTGKEPLEECVELVQVDPSSRHVFADGTEVSLPNASRAGVGRRPGRGARRGRRASAGATSWSGPARPGTAPAGRSWRSPCGRTGRCWPSASPIRRCPTSGCCAPAGAGTLAEVGAWELRDPRLAALLDSYALAYGLDPGDAPASAAVLPYLEHAFGTWYVRGGMRELARAVYERCLARKVEFVFGAEVTGSLEKDGRAAGVELADGHGRGGRLRGRRRALAPGPTWRGAVRCTARRRVAPRRRGLAPAGSRCCWRCAAPARRTPCTARSCTRPDPEDELEPLLGWACRPAAHRPLRGPTTRRCAPTTGTRRWCSPRRSPSQAHARLDRGRCGTPSPTGWSPPPSGPSRGCASGCCGARCGPRADTRRRRAPRAARCPRPPWPRRRDGCCTRPTARACRACSPSGGWSHPGGGLPHAGMSGALVAGLIVEGPEFRGSQ